MNLYKINEINEARFYQLPKELFDNEKYRTSLSSDAKVIYALLLDRMELSRKNNWINENGEIYLFFTRKELGEMVGVTEKTVSKAMKQLRELGLIYEKRQGLTQANIIYIGKIDYSTPEAKRKPGEKEAENSVNTLNSKFYRSGTVNFTDQEEKILPRNDTDLNETEYIHTEINKEDISACDKGQVDQPEAEDSPRNEEVSFNLDTMVSNKATLQVEANTDIVTIQQKPEEEEVTPMVTSRPVSKHNMVLDSGNAAAVKPWSTAEQIKYDNAAMFEEVVVGGRLYTKDARTYFAAHLEVSLHPDLYPEPCLNIAI